MNDGVFEVSLSPADYLVEHWRQRFSLFCRRIGHPKSMSAVGRFLDKSRALELVQAIGQYAG